MKYRKGSGIEESEEDVGLDGGVDLPQAFADETAHPKAGIRRARAEQKRRAGNSNNTSWILPFGILMLVVLVSSYFLVSQHEDNLVKHLKSDERIHEQEMSREFDVIYAELKQENVKLKQQLKHHQELQTENEKAAKDDPQRIDLEKQVEQLTAYKKKMQENIQFMSKTALLKK